MIGIASVVHQILAPKRILARAEYTRVEAHFTFVFGNGDVGAEDSANAGTKGSLMLRVLNHDGWRVKVILWDIQFGGRRWWALSTKRGPPRSARSSRRVVDLATALLLRVRGDRGRVRSRPWRSVQVP